MARCQCAGSSCSCRIVGAGGLKVTGSGTSSAPYTLDDTPYFVEVDTSDYPDGHYIMEAAGLGSRAIVVLYVRQNGFNFHLPDPNQMAPGSEIIVLARHNVNPGDPQWSLNIDGGITYYLAGSALPAADGSMVTLYRCNSFQGITTIQATVSVDGP